MTDTKKQKLSLTQKALAAAGIGAATGALLLGGKKLLAKRAIPSPAPIAPLNHLLPDKPSSTWKPVGDARLDNRKDFEESVYLAKKDPLVAYKAAKKIHDRHVKLLLKRPYSKESRAGVRDSKEMMSILRPLVDKKHW